MAPETPAAARPNSVPTLFIGLELYIAISKLCKENRLEWSLFGKTRKRPSGDYELVDLKIPKQKNTSASTEMTEEGLEELFDEISEDMFDPNPDAPRWNVWIHSHNVMGCFWSGTDHNQMDEFSKLGSPVMLSVVVSMRGGQSENLCNMLGSFSVYSPFRGDFEMDVKPVLDEEAYEETYRPLWKAEVQADTTAMSYKSYLYAKLYESTALFDRFQEDLKDKEVYPHYSGYQGGFKGIYEHEHEERKILAEADTMEAAISESDISEVLKTAAFNDGKRNQKFIDQLMGHQWGFSAFLNMAGWTIDLLARMYNMKEREVKRRLIKALPDPEPNVPTK